MKTSRLLLLILTCVFVFSAFSSAKTISRTSSNSVQYIPAKLSGSTTSTAISGDITVTEPIGELKDFPTRTVVLLPTYSSEGSPDLANYMSEQTANIFKYPYYELTRGAELTPPSKVALQLATEQYNVDIAVVPAIDEWSYRTRTSFLSGEDYVQAYLQLSLYSYNRLTGIYQRQTVSYSNSGDSLDVPSPERIMSQSLDRLFEKFPYHRTPTDIPRYDSLAKGVETPTLSLQPKSPISLPSSIHQL